MVKLVTPEPPDKKIPPVGVEYQSNVAPIGAVPVNITVPDPQRETLFTVGTGGKGFTVILTLSLHIFPLASVTVR